MIRNKKGFTLVELLAVIVILAVVLIIAVPQIITTINETRGSALVSSAKLIATSAEKRKLENDTLGITLQEYNCDDLVKKSDDYSSCKISFDESGIAHVTLKGAGKFKGKYVCSGTKSSAIVSDDACVEYQITIIENGISTISSSIPVGPYTLTRSSCTNGGVVDSYDNVTGKVNVTRDELALCDLEFEKEVCTKDTIGQIIGGYMCTAPDETCFSCSDGQSKVQLSNGNWTCE